MATSVKETGQNNKAYQLMDQLSKAKWYENAGKPDNQAVKQLEQFLVNLNVDKYEIQLASKDEARQLISEFTFKDSAVWDKLKDIPDQLKEKIDQVGKNEELNQLVDLMPEAIYLRTFERAYELFEDKKLIEYLVVHGMYLSLLICTGALAEDELFNPIVDMIEAGNIPFGIKGNTIYVL